MLRKSLQILTGAVLLTLTAIVGYSLLHFSGPDDTLAEAEQAVGRGDLVRAIALLDFTERDVAGDRERTERLLRLRYAAATELGNDARALQDVESLLELVGDRDETLRLDQIYLLARQRDGEAARAAAQRFLVDHPDHGRALELAGEACQTLYQPVSTQLFERLERELPRSVRTAARDAGFAYLYRPAGDPEVERALAELAELHARDTRLAALWQSLAREFAALRERVQEGLDYFRRSLELPGERVAAFRAWSLSLAQSRRTDDLLAACEIQRRRFRHRYVDEAGADAANALLREGQPRAALASAERWLVPGLVKSRFDNKELGPGLYDLMLARTWAAHRVGDRAAVQRAWNDAFQLQGVQPTPPANMLALALQQWHQPNDARNAERTLEWAATTLARTPVPVGRFDYVPGVAALWLEATRRVELDEAAQQRVIRIWRDARPGTVEPLLAHTELLLAHGRIGGALTGLSEARELAPLDTDLEARHLELSLQHARDTGRDGGAMLAECVALDLKLPQVRGPADYLLCGEAALRQRHYALARQCAKAAIEAFPRSRPPRLLELRTSLASGSFVDAHRQATRLLDLLPPDDATLELALLAAQQVGADRRELLHTAIAAPGGSATLQLALLREANAARPTGAHAFVLPAARRPDAPRELQLVAARALANAGDADGAWLLLVQALTKPIAAPAATPAPARGAGEAQRTGAPGAEPAGANAATAAAPSAGPEPSADAAHAFAAWLAAAAARAPDAALAPVVQQTLAALGELDATACDVLLPAARALAERHPACALAIAVPALAGADPEDRGGADHALVGRLAARAGRWRLAEECWTGALAFAAGTEAAEDLARLCLALGRPERARQVVALVPEPRDPALALRFERFDHGAKRVAEELLLDRADLLAQCTLAVFSPTATVDWRPSEGAEREERLDLLILLRDPAMAALAVPRAETLLQQAPGAVATRLLLARALADRGDGAAAAAIHAALDRENVTSPVFVREIALAARAPGYVVSPALRARVIDAAATEGIAGSEISLGFAATISETALRDGGHPELADQLRVDVWQVAPRRNPLTGADLDLVATHLAPLAAWTVLDAALQRPGSPVRAAAIDRLHQLARIVAADQRAGIEPLYAAAQRYLTSDGARGSIVHFLIDHAKLVPDLAPSDAEQRTMLEQHLAAVAAGADVDGQLDATVRRLHERHGLDATLAALDGQLRARPTALPLWRARCRLLAGTHFAVAATGALRAVIQKCEAPELALELLTLAAEARDRHADDAARFAALPAALRNAPAGRYVQALSALREGRPDDALPLLANAPERPDGMHLFALGLAALQSRAPDGGERARAAFAQLVRDYPSSSLARNAGSFAIQLALR